jgi:hypothetical protein
VSRRRGSVGIIGDNENWDRLKRAMIAETYAMKNIDVARDAYIISRQARGLLISEEGLDLITIPRSPATVGCTVTTFD